MSMTFYINQNATAIEKFEAKLIDEGGKVAKKTSTTRYGRLTVAIEAEIAECDRQYLMGFADAINSCCK